MAVVATFEYRGTTYEHFDSPYNTTALNERAVEIPIALAFMPPMFISRSTLEVGNVLSHYGYAGHRIVDLYEHAEGVENIDVFDIDGSYGTIVSISTLEHVRWDTEPVDRHGASRALDRLVGLLAPGGRMLVTVPGGHNDYLDRYLSTGAGATHATTLALDVEGLWHETPELVFLPYGTLTKWASSVFIGEWIR